MLLVETLLVFHESELAPHRLAIISCIPECVPISEYRILLPEVNPETNDIIPIETYRPRDQDWLEDMPELIEPTGSNHFLYDFFTHLQPGNLTVEIGMGFYFVDQ